MLDRNNEEILEESKLEELNIFINNVIDEKKHIKFNYDGLEMILKRMLLRKKRMPPNTKIKVVKILTREELSKVCFDFFDTIDPQISNRIKKNFLNQYHNIKTNMYNVHCIEDFQERDEHDIKEYSLDGSVDTKKGYSTVHLPLGGNISREIYQAAEGKMECTLEDLYIVVHEMAHTLDLEPEKTVPKIQQPTNSTKVHKRKNTDSTRELLTETTAIFFEKLLTNYLLYNTSYSKDAIQQMANDRENLFYSMTRDLYCKLVLAKTKEKNGEIGIEDIRSIMEEYRLTPKNIQNIINQMLLNRQSINFQRRYVLASLFTPTMLGKYYSDQENGKNILKEYIQNIKENNFDNALDKFGIKLTDPGINQLIENKNIYQAAINSITKKENMIIDNDIMFV